MRRQLQFVISAIFACSLLAGGLWPVSGSAAAAPQRQTGPAAALLDAMTPAERVGQLFIVSFYGASAADDTEIYSLIANYKVGGVILAAANDNIIDTLHAPEQVLTLTNQLQAAAAAGAAIPRPGPDAGTPDDTLPPYLPLLVAINHEGDGYPFAEIQSGLTALPNEMAIGATWDPLQAEAVGRIAGTELSAVGVNMLIGPSLDVLETPRPEGTDLGTRVFGGDPYWVGVMGAAYVRGVHSGAGGKVAVIAKHFPGHGGSDRRPEDELPTVRKSFDDLQNFDLVPFYAVTGGAALPEAVADGLLDAHIRFQGFQGNIRQNTAPVSFDAEALGQLLSLPPIAAWRGAGGVTVSDSLGAQAIKSFYDPTLRTFPYRRIAREAFNAGNDLLLLTDFGLDPRIQQTGNVTQQTAYIIDTLTSFTQLYQADPNFAARVDAAALRVLNLKLRLYGGAVSPAAANLPVSSLAALLRDQGDVPALAQAAAALISPTLDEPAPEPPSSTERIVFFTDVRQGQQCSTCLRYSLLDKHLLEATVADLYGANGSGQVRATNLQSFSFEELAEYLDSPAPAAAGDETPTPEPSPLEAALQSADWVVFAMLNVTPDVPSSRVVSTFLAQRPEIARSKKVVVFAFNAPYYLDTTDLTKLTAYYALYSRTPAFVTVAARLLFRDLTPHGAPPVSVHSVGYDLIEVTRPDPRQIIKLDWQAPTPPESATPQAPGLHLGDTITLTTGVIVDHNGHPVPDQTPVIFRVFYTEQGLPENIQVSTVGGVASYPLQLNRAGRLEITASSDPAVASNLLQITAQEGSAFFVTQVVPTVQPSETPQPTATDIPPTATASLTPTATATPVPFSPAVDWRGFFVMVLGLFAVLVGGYRLGTLDEPQPRFGVRVALAGAIGVLLGYNYYALVLPGSAIAYWWLGALAGPVCGVIGGIFGLAAGWYLVVGRHQSA
jgi:beta-N-acetylhexosaminidase